MRMPSGLSRLPFEAPTVKLSDQFLALPSKLLCLADIVVLQSLLNAQVNHVRVNLEVGVGVEAVILRSGGRDDGGGGWSGRLLSAAGHQNNANQRKEKVSIHYFSRQILFVGVRKKQEGCTLCTELLVHPGNGPGGLASSAKTAGPFMISE